MNNIQAIDCENCRHQVAGNGHKFLGLDGLGGILVCPEFTPVPDSSQNSGCIARANGGDEKTPSD